MVGETGFERGPPRSCDIQPHGPLSAAGLQGLSRAFKGKPLAFPFRLPKSRRFAACLCLEGPGSYPVLPTS